MNEDPGLDAAKRWAAERDQERNTDTFETWNDEPADDPGPTEAARPDPASEPTDKGGSDKAAPPFTFVDGAKFILDSPDRVPVIWGSGDEVLWARDESLMIAGTLGVGKTTLALLLLRARLGLADQVLGYPVIPTDGTILYLAMDRPKQIARAAGRIFTEADRDILAYRVKIWEGPPRSDVARNPYLLTEMALDAGAETMFLDSVKDAVTGLSEDEVGARYNRARQYLLRDANCQLLENHHTTKRGQGGGPPTTVADVYGSAWIANGTGSILLLNGEPSEPIVKMQHVRCPASEVGPYQLIHDQAAGTMDVYRKTDLLELVRLSYADGLTARDAAVVMFDIPPPAKPSDGQVEKARRKLAALETEGLLISVSGGRGRGVKPTAWFLAERTEAP